jgi:pyrimidine operon attenuation protein / uracil phosphoribosyltransferase
MRLLLDSDAVNRGLRRVAGEIVERHRGTADLILIGVRRGGVPIATRLQSWLRELEGEVPLGTVDITLYRDDAATALPNPRIGPSDIPHSLAGAHVIVVDDVLYTGRTVRAALDALMDYGRPKRVELAVLIDRKGRELPIQADYVVREVDVPEDQRVDVVSESGELKVVTQPFVNPTIPPEAS